MHCRQLEEVHAVSAALRLLSDARPEDLLPGLLPTLADQVKAAPELWRQVEDELRKT